MCTIACCATGLHHRCRLFKLLCAACRLQQQEEAAAAHRQGVEEQKQFEALQARYGFTDQVGRALYTWEYHCLTQDCSNLSLTLGACMQRSGSCRMCGHEGHWERECPQNPDREL